MKRITALISASALALTATAAPVKVATQKWVLQQIAKTGTRVLDATVTTNANGSITIYSAATFPDIPKCCGVSLTVSGVTNTTRTAAARTPEPGFLDLFVGRALAAYPDTVKMTVTVHVDSGAWYDSDAAGNLFPHPFNLGTDGMNLELQRDFPDKPDTAHTCELDADCNCKGMGKTAYTIEYPADLADWDAKKITSELGDWRNWIDTEHLPEDVTATTRRGQTYYYLQDADGIYLNLDNLALSDAWARALLEAMGDINSYLGECREAYATAAICDKTNPQHDWVQKTCGGHSWNVCRRNSSHMEGTEAHSYPGAEYDSSSHSCSCGEKTQRHSWTDWQFYTRTQGIVIYKRNCTVCPQTETKSVADDGAICDTQNDIHYPKSDQCGCLCGKYGSDGLASFDINFHKWDDTTDANGIQVCLCKCGNFHINRAPTTYLINARRACTAVCAYCKDKSSTGIGITSAPDESHTPCEVSDGHCGCLCGKLTADNTKIAKFHIQKPGSCRCLGANGNGGSWHFPEPRTDCKMICTYLINGQQHLAATEKEDGNITVAHPRHHTKTSGARCGCECGTYTGSNYSTWEGENFHNSKPYYCGCYCAHGSEAQVPNFHKKSFDTDCDCQCGAKLVSHVAPTAPECKCQGKCRVDGPKHFPVCSDGKCPGVCHGNCRESKEEGKRDKHSPEGSTRCGCQCNELGAEGFEALAYHQPRGTPSCWCTGHHYHTHTAKDGCHNLCAYCNQITASDRKSTYAAADSDHTFLGSRCVCECDDEVERDHIYGNRQSSAAETETCDTCGQTITNYIDTWTCKRCGDVTTGGHQEGHDPSCGKKHAGDSGQLSYCEKHNISYAGTECPECEKESEDNGSGGTDIGENSGNQSGDPDDIL
ncbi:MAG: hypothetical protein ACI4Q3_00630 [Kiritimatiellia bacterium]